MTLPLAPNQVAARIDRLPVGRFHYRFLILIALGTWFDYYDNFVAGALALALPAAGVLPAAEPGQWISPLGLFMAALPFGMILGTVFLGLASDYFGRRLGFIAMLLLYSLASLAGGAGYYPLTWLAGQTAGLILLIGTRVLAGAGIGAENVIIDAYISEMVPRQIRGRAVASAHAAAFTAVPVAAILARWLAPEAMAGRWWLLLVIGSLGACLSWYFRRNLPESPRWLAGIGRFAEAEKTLVDIESAIERESGKSLPPVSVQPSQAVTRSPLAIIWSPAYRGRTLLLVGFHLLQTIGYYGFMHWLGLLLRAKNWSYNDALTMQFAASLLAPVGPLFAVWFSERWQRKWLIVALALVVALGQIAFSWIDQAVPLVLLAAGIILCLNWFSAVFHAYQAELYPTEARGTGIGFTYAWSRVSMVGLGLIMPGLIATHLPAAFGLMAAALGGVALAVGFFGPQTNARTLEELSPPPGSVS